MKKTGGDLSLKQLIVMELFLAALFAAGLLLSYSWWGMGGWNR